MGFGRQLGSVGAVSLVAALLVPARAQEEPPISWAEPRRVCDLSDPQIRESSGLDASRADPAVFWTHNDSGDGPRLFAIDAQGHTRGAVLLEGATAVDWEDVCAFHWRDRAWLLVGDVGDNDGARDHVVLYLVEDPAGLGMPNRVIPAATLRVRFEGGPRDCEAVAFDETTATVLLVSKEPAASVYALTWPEEPPLEPAVARKVGALGTPALATALDVSRDGLLAVVITKDGGGHVWTRGAGEDWAAAFARPSGTIALPERRQGEAVCFDALDDRSLWLTSEKLPTPLFHVPVVGAPPSEVAAVTTSASLAVPEPVRMSFAAEDRERLREFLEARYARGPGSVLPELGDGFSATSSEERFTDELFDGPDLELLRSQRAVARRSWPEPPRELLLIDLGRPELDRLYDVHPPKKTRQDLDEHPLIGLVRRDLRPSLIDDLAQGDVDARRLRPTLTLEQRSWRAQLRRGGTPHLTLALHEVESSWGPATVTVVEVELLLDASTWGRADEEERSRLSALRERLAGDLSARFPSARVDPRTVHRKAHDAISDAVPCFDVLVLHPQWPGWALVGVCAVLATIALLIVRARRRRGRRPAG